MSDEIKTTEHDEAIARAVIASMRSSGGQPYDSHDMRTVALAIAAARAEEREACVRIAIVFSSLDCGCAKRIADVIRARGNEPGFADTAQGDAAREPAQPPQHEAAPADSSGARCSLCGASRIDEVAGTYGACGNLECRDPLHDYRKEHAPVELPPEPPGFDDYNLLNRAIAIVRAEEMRFVGVSLMRARLGTGFNRTQRILEKMESMGVVGPLELGDGYGRRAVLTAAIAPPAPAPVAAAAAEVLVVDRPPTMMERATVAELRAEVARLTEQLEGAETSHDDEEAAHLDTLAQLKRAQAEVARKDAALRRIRELSADAEDKSIDLIARAALAPAAPESAGDKAAIHRPAPPASEPTREPR